MKYINKKTLVFFLLAAVFIFGAFLFSKGNFNQASYQGVDVKGDVKESVSEEIVDYANTVFKNEALPSEIEIRKVKEDELERHYVTGWQQQDQLFYNILFVENSETNEGKYKRAWVIFLGEEIDEEFSENIIKQVFKDSYLKNAQTDLSCRQITGKETQEDQTECFSMAELEGEGKIGLSVTSPVTLPSSASGIFVTTCLVPENGAAFYKEDTCI